MIGKFEDWELLGMVLGAAGHDVGHPGRSILERQSSKQCLVG
jgi:hypothetical protein